MDPAISCRLCLNFVKESDRILLNQQLRETFKEAIGEELLDSHKDFPNFSCCTCVSNLNTCLDLKRSFIKAQNLLNDLFNVGCKPQFENVKVEVSEEGYHEEIYIKSEPDFESEDFKIVESFPTASSEEKHEVLNSVSCSESGLTLNKASLKAHMKSMHKIKTDSRCDVCGRKKSMQNHKCKQSDKKLGCPEGCNATFSRAYNLKLHLKTVHSASSETFECRFCDKQFSSKFHLKQHCAVHKNQKTVACKICGTVVTPQYLPVHIKYLHSDRKKMFCDVCNRKFYKKTSLRTHLKFHFDVKDVPCIDSNCKSSFVSETRMKSHFEYVHQKIRKYTVTCEQCGKILASKSAYEDHVRAKHTGERSLACDFPNCNRKFFGSAELRIHKKSFHQPPKKCPICSKEYKNMTTHLKSHEAVEDPVVCELTDKSGQICGKSFSTKERLILHQNNQHGGFRKYSCDQCELQYNQKTHLVLHQRIVHEGLRIKCHLCPNIYVTRKEYYRRHINLHHNELDSATKANICKQIAKMDPKSLYVKPDTN